MSGTAQRPVLLLDADQASALAIVRALGQQGIPVHAASDAKRPLAGLSRHASALLRYPDPLRDEAAFVAWLIAQMRDGRFELAIPVTERTVTPILRHRQMFDGLNIAMAPSEALERVLDKNRTLQLAQELGIAVPRSALLTSMDELAASAAGFAYPVVVKPSRSVGQDRGQRVQLTVSYAHNASELAAQARHALRYGQVILQEYFRGDGVGIELIADHGSVRYMFQHRRLHEVPLTGGGSSLRISEAIVPALRAAAEQLMQALAWHGVAMVEFKYQPTTGQFRLMEINGRFWGSLPLAVAAGANFPLMLHELMTTGQVRDHPPARIGAVCRQLARDLDWLEQVLRKDAPPALVKLPSLREVLRDSLLVFSPRHQFDVQSLRDPWPGLVDLWRIGRKQWLRVWTVLRHRRRLTGERRAGGPNGAGQRLLQRSHRLLFLCYGNINRSALAHAYANSRYPERFEYASAGFHAPGGRPADPMMVEIAATAGIDLSSWQSNTLTEGMVSRADVILAMEVAHLDRLLQEYPAARGRAYLLGAATASSADIAEVSDPYGHSRSTYDRVSRQVFASVDAWCSPLVAPPQDE